MMAHLTSTRHTIKSMYIFMNDLGIDIRHDAEVLLNASIRGDIDLTPNMAPEKFLDREMFLRKPYQALHDAMKAAHDSWDEVMVCFNVSLPPDIDLEKELQCWESLLHVMEIIKGQESRFKKNSFLASYRPKPMSGNAYQVWKSKSRKRSWTINTSDSIRWFWPN